MSERKEARVMILGCDIPDGYALFIRRLMERVHGGTWLTVYYSPYRPREDESARLDGRVGQALLPASVLSEDRQSLKDMDSVGVAFLEGLGGQPPSDQYRYPMDRDEEGQALTHAFEMWDHERSSRNRITATVSGLLSHVRNSLTDAPKTSMPILGDGGKPVIFLVGREGRNEDEVERLQYMCKILQPLVGRNLALVPVGKKQRDDYSRLMVVIPSYVGGSDENGKTDTLTQEAVRGWISPESLENFHVEKMYSLSDIVFWHAAGREVAILKALSDLASDKAIPPSEISR